MNLFPAKSYLKYLLKAKHYKGYGIHSPFMYELVREVLWDKHPYYAFSEIEKYRKELLHSKKVIHVSDFGAGSHKLNSDIRKIHDIYGASAIKRKYGEFLFRLVSRYKSQTIVEMGTSLGVSTMYLALPEKQNRVYTIEGCTETADIANEAFKKQELSNVNLFTGRFVDVLPVIFEEIETIDLLFVDGHHDKDATLEYFRMCKEKAGNNSIFVFDDIHWSEGMEEAWEEVHNDSDVTISADLYQLGLVFFCRECKKQHYVLLY